MSVTRCYADADDFARFCPDTGIDAERLGAVLEDASREVDGMTFNRIPAARCRNGTAAQGEADAVGFDALTPFQRELVKRAVCLHAAFRAEYGEWIDSPLESYGINGVSMGFGSGGSGSASGVVERGGVKTSSRVLALLRQTGLCFLGV